jgi:capsular polysaccharide biosynthesis protein
MDGFAALRRWWWMLLAGAVVAALVAYAIVSTLDEQYTAGTRLLVGPIAADKDTLEASGQLARTYAELATSEPLVRDVAQQVGRDEPVEDIVDDMATASNDINRIVSVSVTDTNAERASRMARGVAERLIEISRASEEPDETTIDALMREPEVLALERPQRAALQRAATRVLTEARAGRIEVVEPASKPDSPSAPRKSLLVALAALAGLIATGLFIFLRATAEEAGADPQKLAEVREAPYLGAVDASGRRAGELRAGQGYGYRLLAGRTGLLSGSPAGTSLLVLDVGDGHAAATVALNLAAALDYDGRSVLLIDAALENGMITGPSGEQDELSFRDLLSSGAPDRTRLDELTVERMDGLRVVPLGGSAKRFIDVVHARDIVKSVTHDGSVAIVAGASIHRSAATLSWSRAVDGNLLVVDSRVESRDQLAELAQTLVGLGANISGSVIGRTSTGQWWRATQTSSA